MWGEHRYRITKEIAIHLTRIIRELVTIFSKQWNIVLNKSEESSYLQKVLCNLAQASWARLNAYLVPFRSAKVVK